jgi:hypothetical protein
MFFLGNLRNRSIKVRNKDLAQTKAKAEEQISRQPSSSPAGRVSSLEGSSPTPLLKFPITLSFPEEFGSTRIQNVL